MLREEEPIFKMLTALSRSRGRHGTVFKKKEPKGIEKGLTVPSVCIQANGTGRNFLMLSLYCSRRWLEKPARVASGQDVSRPRGGSITRRNDGSIEILSPVSKTPKKRN